MPRISSNSFAVNASLEQQMEIAAVKSGVEFPITTAVGTELDTNLVKVGGTAITLDQQVMTNSLPVVIASDQTAVFVKNETGDPLDIDVLKFGGTDVTLGEKSMSASIPVVIADDQTPVSVSPATANNATLAAAQQVAVFGHDGANYRRLNCSTGGNLKVESELENHSGTQGNLSNAASVISGDFSSAIDTSNHTLLTLFGNTSDTTSAITPQVSANGTDYYPAGFDIYPDSNGNFYQNFPNVASNNFRLKYNGTATVTATLLHNNH